MPIPDAINPVVHLFSLALGISNTMYSLSERHKTQGVSIACANGGEKPTYNRPSR